VGVVEGETRTESERLKRQELCGTKIAGRAIAATFARAQMMLYAGGGRVEGRWWLGTLGSSQEMFRCEGGSSSADEADENAKAGIGA
jgi:hypothetical protein